MICLFQKKRIIQILLISLIILLSGCDSGGGSSSSDNEAYVTGSAGDGPITGGNITVVDADGKTICETTSDSTAKWYCAYNSTEFLLPYTVTLTGGTDIVSNETNVMTLKSLVTDEETTVANINPFTTLIYEALKQLGGATDNTIAKNNIQSVTDSVVETFNYGLPDSFDPRTGTADSSNIYQILMANEAAGEMIRRIRDQRIGEGETVGITDDEILAILGQDMSDGVLDGESASPLAAPKMIASVKIMGKITSEDLAKLAVATQANIIDLIVEMISDNLTVTTQTSGSTAATSNIKDVVVNNTLQVSGQTPNDNPTYTLTAKTKEQFDTALNTAINVIRQTTGANTTVLENLKNAISGLETDTALSTSDLGQVRNLATGVKSQLTAVKTAINNLSTTVIQTIVEVAIAKPKSNPFKLSDATVKVTDGASSWTETGTYNSKTITTNFTTDFDSANLQDITSGIGGTQPTMAIGLSRLMGSSTSPENGIASIELKILDIVGSGNDSTRQIGERQLRALFNLNWASSGNTGNVSFTAPTNTSKVFYYSSDGTEETEANLDINIGKSVFANINALPDAELKLSIFELWSQPELRYFLCGPQVPGDYYYELSFLAFPLVNSNNNPVAKLKGKLTVDGTSSVCSSNSAPMANAGLDQNVAPQSLVTLDGSESTDADSDDTLTYSWSFTSKPTGTTATLSDSTAVTPSFTADVEGSYVLSLVVNDGLQNSTNEATVTINTTSVVANAGADQNIQLGDTAILDGSGSNTTGDGTLSYKWTGILATLLSDTTAVKPTFTPTSEGIYTFKLTVTDTNAVSSSDTVTITAAKLILAPVVSGESATNDDTPTWSWTAGEESNYGAFRYSLDNSDLSNVAETTETSYTPDTGLNDGEHILYVQQSGAVGNWSESGVFAITIDTTPPNAPTVSGDSTTIDTTPTWSWTAGGGGNGIFRVKLDDSDLSTGATETASTSYTPASALSEATHTLYVQERDAVGNWSDSGSFDIVVDTTPPSAPTVSGDTLYNSDTPTWSWTAGGGGNGTYRVKLDDADLSTGATDLTEASFTPGTALSEGEHVLYVQERDAAGNWSTSASLTFTIDTTPPVVTVSQTTTDFISSLEVTLTCTDTGGSGCENVYYSLNGSTPGIYSSAIEVNESSTLQFYAVDTASNQSEAQTETYTQLTTTVSVTPGPEQNTVTWSAVSGATSYNLYWTTNPNDLGSITLVANATSPYVHTNLTAGTTYYYVVTAVDANGEGTTSEVASGVPEVAVPAAPGNVTATAGDGQVTLSWSDVAEATSYKIYYATSTGVTIDSVDYADNATSGEVISSLTNGTPYYFIVTAINAGGESEASSEVSATPLSGTVAISANGFNIVALQSDGSVTAWSDNSYGTMGHTPGTNSDVYIEFLEYYNSTPTPISGLSGVVSVAAGNKHSLALKDDGTVWAWGLSHYGALGYATDVSADPTIDLGLGDEHYSSTPVQVSGLTNVVAIAAGVGFSLALKSDGSVWAWGENFAGQLGDNSGAQQQYTPVQVVDHAGTGTLSGIIAIAAGGANAFAVANDGTLWAWGSNSAGELGLGNYTDQPTPTQVSSLSNVVSVKAGGSFSMALKSDGTVWTWGDNFNGQLGNDSTDPQNTPVQVSGLTGVQEIAAGMTSGFAIKSDGTAWAWGSNNVSQLGDGGDTTDELSPVQITASSDLVEIASGDFATIALKSDGTVQMWGSNSNGELGHEPNTNGDLTSEFGDYYSAAAVQLAISSAKSIAAPTAVSATGGGGTGEIPVSWTAVTGASYYNVYWSTSPGVNVLNSTKVSGVSSGDNITGLTNGTRYYLVVTAVDDNGKESAASIEVTAVP